MMNIIYWNYWRNGQNIFKERRGTLKQWMWPLSFLLKNASIGILAKERSIQLPDLNKMENKGNLDNICMVVLVEEGEGIKGAISEKAFDLSWLCK